MNWIALSLIFTALLVSNGCKALMNSPPSSFLYSFSLEALVKQNRSPSGLICAEGGMGGMGAGNFSVGREQSSASQVLSFACQTRGDSFDEIAFLQSLKEDVEQAITRSGATIVSRGSPDPAGFYFEYNDGHIQGRISIDGKESHPHFLFFASQVRREDALVASECY